MLAARLERDNLAASFAVPLGDSNGCSSATRLKNPQGHNQFDPAHPDTHPSVPHLIVGNDIGKLRQSLLHTHTPTSDSERRDCCVIWLTFVSPVADGSTDLRRTDSCDASSSGQAANDNPVNDDTPLGDAA